jgi:neutral ceramidase
MKNKIRMIVMLIILLVSAIAFSGPEIDQWTVGVARIDITPKDSVWLAGYASRDHAATGALHPLWAKAMTLEDAHGNLGVLVTTDVLGFPKRLSNYIRDACESTYGLERAQIILSSSHTHTGPVLLEGLYDIYPLNKSRIKKIEAYSEHLKYDIIRVIGLALGNAAPAQLYADNGVVRFQVNRRNNNAGTLDAQSDLNGPNDYAVPVLQVRRDDDLVAAAFGYACHPTVLSSYEWSGDYPGFAQVQLEKDYPEITAMFFQGCGADQNPLPRRTVGLAKQYGRELAAAVENVLESGGEPLASNLQTAYAEIDLAFSEPLSVKALQKASSSPSSYQRRWARRLLATKESGQPLETSYSYPVQVWRLGEQMIVALGGEVVIDYAIQLKRIFGQDVFVMGYANDVMGYIPSTRVLREGGYEGLTSQIVYGQPAAWNADIETRIMSATVQLAKKAGVTIPPAQLIAE